MSYVQYPNRNSIMVIEDKYYMYLIGKQEKRVTFDYAFNKAFLLTKELQERGWMLPLPLAHNKGTVEGWSEFLLITEQVKEYYEATGFELEGLLNPELIGFEGRRVNVMTEKGKVENFVVGRWGRYAPYHVKQWKKGQRGGGKVDSRYISVELDVESQ